MTTIPGIAPPPPVIASSTPSVIASPPPSLRRHPLVIASPPPVIASAAKQSRKLSLPTGLPRYARNDEGESDAVTGVVTPQ